MSNKFTYKKNSSCVKKHFSVFCQQTACLTFCRKRAMCVNIARNTHQSLPKHLEGEHQLRSQTAEQCVSRLTLFICSAWHVSFSPCWSVLIHTDCAGLQRGGKKNKSHGDQILVNSLTARVTAFCSKLLSFKKDWCRYNLTSIISLLKKTNKHWT